ncbi:MAG: PD-(D/E)XK nuclease family protein [Bacteroidales bacterium]|nr:PD-(D/E)XK nuclease family protein [Bacteroidales bacterium]
MENLQNLLNQVALISEKNAEILDAAGGRFNMFRVCGVNHYENTHSAIIAEFLNPNGSHSR